MDDAVSPPWAHKTMSTQAAADDDGVLLLLC
jgi:hypothetical protein